MSWADLDGSNNGQRSVDVHASTCHNERPGGWTVDMTDGSGWRSIILTKVTDGQMVNGGRVDEVHL